MRGIPHAASSAKKVVSRRPPVAPELDTTFADSAYKIDSPLHEFVTSTFGCEALRHSRQLKPVSPTVTPVTNNKCHLTGNACVCVCESILTTDCSLRNSRRLAWAGTEMLLKPGSSNPKLEFHWSRRFNPLHHNVLLLHSRFPRCPRCMRGRRLRFPHPHVDPLGLVTTADVDIGGLTTTTVSDTGGKEIKLLKDPRGILDSFPEDSFTITNSTGSHPSFNGAKVSRASCYLANLRADAFGFRF